MLQPTSIRVLVADSHMLRPITNLLLSYPQVTVVGVASNLVELLTVLGQEQPDVVLIDLHILESSRDSAVLDSLLRDSKLVVTSLRTDEEKTGIAKTHGAVKLLSKAELAVTLISTIEECVRK
jgi:DNA-binding NarL/FixJ family response regulator